MASQAALSTLRPKTIRPKLVMNLVPSRCLSTRKHIVSSFQSRQNGQLALVLRPRNTFSLAKQQVHNYTAPNTTPVLDSTSAVTSNVSGANIDREKLWPDWKPPTKGILSKLPAAWVPYAELMRVEKPGGLYGFYFPYLIGLSYAACIAPGITPTLLVSTAGTLLVWNVFLRGAACTINDNLDREYDRQVARCRTRPIARGAVTPLQGHIWYGVQTVFGIAAISQLPNAWNCFLHAVPIQFLVSVYPLGKRITDYPQVILSVPLAWAVVMASVTLGVDPFTVGNTAIAAATSTLCLSHAIWIIVFDYVNACQDTLDDIKAGVRSMAVRYQNTEAFIGALGSAQVACLVATGVLAGFGPLYFIGACGGNAALLLAMAMTAKRSKPKNCAWWFSYGSMLVGGTTVLGLLAEYTAKLMRENSEEQNVAPLLAQDGVATISEVSAEAS